MRSSSSMSSSESTPSWKRRETIYDIHTAVHGSDAMEFSEEEDYLKVGSSSSRHRRKNETNIIMAAYDSSKNCIHEALVKYAKENE